VITPALAAFGGAVTRAVRFVNDLDESTAQVITQLSFILPVATLLATLLGGPVALAIGGLTATIIALGRAWQTNFVGIRDDVQRFVSLVRGVLPAAQNAFESFIQGVAFSGLMSELDAYTTALDTQLTASIEALGPVFSDFQTLLEENREEFRVIGNGVGFVLEQFVRLSAGLVNILGPAFRLVIIPAIRVFIEILDRGLTKLSQFIQLASSLRDGNLSQAAGFADELFSGATNPASIAPRRTVPDRATQELRNQIQVRVEGDTGVIENVAVDAANSTVTERERRINRNTNTSFQPRQ